MFLNSVEPGLSAIRKIAVHTGFILLIGLAVWLVVAQTLSSEIYIAPIDIPDSLKKLGVTERGVARSLRGQIQMIRSEALSGGTQYSGNFDVRIATRRADRSADTVFVRPHRQLSELPELEVPEAKISITSLAAYLRAMSWLQHAQIGGEIDESPAEVYSFQGSINGIPVAPKQHVGAGQIPDLIRETALLIEIGYEPDVASLYFSRQDPDQAVAILKDYIASDNGPPRHYAWAFNLWGNILRNRGRYLDAINKYKEAIRLAPRNDTIGAGAHANLGTVYLLVKNYKAAEEEFQAAIAIDPSANNYSNLGIAQKVQGHAEKARDNYTTAIEKNPNFAPAYSNMGNLLAWQDHWTEAMAYYDKAIAIQPSYADAYSNLAYVQSKHGMFEEAIANYTTAIEFELWRNPHTLNSLEDTLARYVDSKPFPAASRNRAIGVCMRLVSALKSVSGAKPSGDSLSHVSTVLNDPRCRI